MSFSFRLCENWNEAKRLIETGDRWFEDYRTNVKPAIDWEKEIPYEEYERNKQKYGSYIKDTVISDLVKLAVEAMQYLGSPVTQKQVLLVDGCRKVTKKGEEFYKISFHVIVNSAYRFKNANEANLLFKAILEIADKVEIDQETVKYIDNSIYASSEDKWKKLRCVLNNKDPLDLGILAPIDHSRNVLHNVTVLDYCLGYCCENTDIEYVEDQKNLLAVRQKKPCQTSRGGRVVAPKTSKVPTENEMYERNFKFVEKPCKNGYHRPCFRT
jgi:hypothetical protein